MRRERRLAGIQNWIEKHLQLQVNEAKSVPEWMLRYVPALMHTALSKRNLQRCGSVMPSALAASG